MCDGLKKVRIGKKEIFPRFSGYSRCDLGARAATSDDLELRVAEDGKGTAHSVQSCVRGAGSDAKPEF